MAAPAELKALAKKVRLKARRGSYAGADEAFHEYLAAAGRNHVPRTQRTLAGGQTDKELKKLGRHLKAEAHRMSATMEARRDSAEDFFRLKARRCTAWPGFSFTRIALRFHDRT